MDEKDSMRQEPICTIKGEPRVGVYTEKVKWEIRQFPTFAGLIKGPGETSVPN